MNFLADDPKKLYINFFSTSIIGAVVMSIYAFVDAIAVGHAEGPLGAAAIAVINPLFGIIVFVSILAGIGGSVLMNNARGEGDNASGDAFFTAAIILVAGVVAVCWILCALFHRELLILFGADEEIAAKAMEYSNWIVGFFPVFVFPIFMGCFIRNDGAPGLAMAAVIIGSCVNMFGDWLLVFPLGMGMRGAAIATLIGNSVQCIIMLSYFFQRRCKLRIIKPMSLKPYLKGILQLGFGASILDLGTVILGVIMNNQVMRYGSAVDLAVYGVVMTIMQLFQSMFNGVGQAIQPLVSANCGAGKADRIRNFWKLSFYSVVIMGLIFTCLGELFPVTVTKIFMDATPEVIAASPAIFRLYFPLFLFLGITTLATYYLQSILRGKMSFAISVLHSAVVGVILLYVLPLWIGLAGVWVAMPVAECIVVIVALIYITKTNRNLNKTLPKVYVEEKNNW